jgi:hypothetical protein
MIKVSGCVAQRWNSIQFALCCRLNSTVAGTFAPLQWWMGAARSPFLPGGSACPSVGLVDPVVGMVREYPFPLWLDRARAIVDENPSLYAAVHSHREGLALMDEHPSLALVCFVSSIENVGSTLVDLVECSECCSKIGAGKRFRKALRTVFTNRETDLLAGAYELRSQTAHAGILHGEEMSLGALGYSAEIFTPRTPSMNFRYQVLWDMSKASKRILVNQLSR